MAFLFLPRRLSSIAARGQALTHRIRIGRRFLSHLTHKRMEHSDRWLFSLLHGINHLADTSRSTTDGYVLCNTLWAPKNKSKKDVFERAVACPDSIDIDARRVPIIIPLTKDPPVCSFQFDGSLVCCQRMPAFFVTDFAVDC